MELQGGQLVDEEGVGEVVVDGLIEAELREGRTEQGVVGAGGLEVVDALEGLVGLAGTREGVVRDDVGGAGHGDEGCGLPIAAAAGAGREAVVLEGLGDVGDQVGSVGSRVEAGVYDGGGAGSGGWGDGGRPREKGRRRVCGRRSRRSGGDDGLGGGDGRGGKIRARALGGGLGGYGSRKVAGWGQNYDGCSDGQDHVGSSGSGVSRCGRVRARALGGGLGGIVGGSGSVVEAIGMAGE